MNVINYNRMLTNLRRLLKPVCLLLLLSGTAASLSGCLADEKFVAVAPNLPNIPEPIVRCLEGRVKVPVGDWTVSMVNRVIQQYQAREDKLEGCMRDVIMFYNTLQQGLKGPTRKGLFR